MRTGRQFPNFSQANYSIEPKRIQVVTIVFFITKSAQKRRYIIDIITDLEYSLARTLEVRLKELRKEAVTQLGYDGFRPVVPEDLTPGAEIYMFDLLNEKANRFQHPTIWGQKVILDPEPVRGEHVFYHQTNRPNFQCFVRIEDFTDPYKPASCGPYEHAFLIKA